MALRIGDTIGDYEITGVLGRGGMGEVFRVRNTLSDRVEAMKVVLSDLMANPEAADRFLREIKVHASLEHPHIAGFRTALRVENQILMVMELVEGVSLAEMLAAGPLDWRDAIGYADQVLSALSFAHKRGVIHRDIKPANILITAAGRVKLTDFGIAHTNADRKLTATGLALGSLYYMSPEQVKSEPLDARSDVYAVGVTLYEMVTGRRPIQGNSDYALMHAQLTTTPVPPSEIVSALPSALSAIIMIALAKNPAERFQTANGFRVTLRALQTPGAELRPIGESMPAPLRRTERSSATPATQPPVFDSNELARIEAGLTAALGPAARQLLTRTVMRVGSLQELRQTLALEILDPREREAFLRSLEPAPHSAQPPRHQPVVMAPPPPHPEAPKATPPPAAHPEAPKTPPAAPVAISWDASLLQNARQKLAPHIGPIAGIIVDRASRKAKTKQELYDLLAAEIPSERDRRTFLASLQ